MRRGHTGTKALHGRQGPGVSRQNCAPRVAAGGWAALLGAATLMIVLLGWPEIARSADEHVLDPTLSLTGDTSVTKVDPIPDPGAIHPQKPFNNPCGVATDAFGNIYVASGATGPPGTEGRINVFGSDGGYLPVSFDPGGKDLSEIRNENGPCDLAVDSTGNLYVLEFQTNDVLRYVPSEFPPKSGTEYAAPAIVHENVSKQCGGGQLGSFAQSIAVDPSNDHLYVSLDCHIAEYDSAVNGSGLIEDGIGSGIGEGFRGVAVWGTNHDVYVSGVDFGSSKSDPDSAKVFVFDGADGHLKLEVPGTNFGKAGVAVDQSNGNFYLDRTETLGAVDQYEADGDFVGSLPQPPKLQRPTPFADISVDAPMVKGESAYKSPNEGYVYVTSGPQSTNPHLYGFRPCEAVGAPNVSGESFSGVTTTEAVLEGTIDPRCLKTTYRFEYVDEASFSKLGWAGATSTPVPAGTISQDAPATGVRQAVAGLAPETTYRFRIVASNEGGTTTGDEGLFSTYAIQPGLPRGRAYELVTPPDTNGRIPTMQELGSGFAGNGFLTSLVTADGNGLVFGTEGGSLPGVGGGGFHDTYEARRGAAGWQTLFNGVSSAQSERPYPGGFSSDHLYAFWTAEGESGTLGKGGGVGEKYIRRPGGVIDATCSPEPTGQFEEIGCGSLGSEAYAAGRWISSGGSHVIFQTVADADGTALQLEPNAPPTGIETVYDRTPDGTTHVVSLLPGDATPNSAATYQGASADGSSVAFKVTEGGVTTMYVRVDNSETHEVETGETVFGGLSRDGTRLFYLTPKEAPLEDKPPVGDIFAFDTETQETTEVGSGGESILVNVSADGSHVYFVSRKQLDGSKGGLGAENLYVWDGSGVRFIATLAPIDVNGEEGKAENGRKVGGLGLWAAYGFNQFPSPDTGPAANPSRLTPDGRYFVFESHVDLTGYESGGRSQIYRYSAESGELICLSCNPTGGPAVSNAQLQSDTGKAFAPFPPVNALTQIDNLTSDGQAVFFESGDRLAARDTDGRIDVYEWRVGGGKDCQRGEGCIRLISSGRSGGDDYLYAVTPDGEDVFFLSGDLLVPQDLDGTPSIYDARVRGGFPPPAVDMGCVGDSCQTSPPAPPSWPVPGSMGLDDSGNASPRRCRKGKRVRKGGRARCVRHRRRSGAKHRGKKQRRSASGGGAGRSQLR